MKQPYEPTPPTDAATALEVLKSLPSFEDTQAQVQAAIDQIKAAASQLIPSIIWETPSEGSSENCQRRPYDQADAQGYFLPHAVAVGVPVSEQQWTKIQEAAKESAAKLDATEVQVMKDQPGNHDVGYYGPTGLFIKVSYGGNLVVSGYTGCRLPRDKK
ncbi:LppA family lipoprotein [Mycobacterium kyorinense]|uniref:Lipoprotein n=1 Tax=Mycobacterium kyorinense TaxID=487514 RepID=A0A1X1XUK4_9MYCO|nr:LppA family lipoprotein [Mycobacterium kyorinense]ORW02542.1 hypothetical protein AWC14_06345 [Mycobacterium kyorinense]